MRFASGALKNISDSYEHQAASTEAEAEAAEARRRQEGLLGRASSTSSYSRLSLRRSSLHRSAQGKQARRRMPSLLGDKGVQAAVRARSSEDARDKYLEAKAATTLQADHRSYLHAQQPLLCLPHT